MWVLAILEGEASTHVVLEHGLGLDGLDDWTVNRLLESLGGVIERLLLLCGSEWAILTLLLGGLWLLELAVGDGSGVSLGDIDDGRGANDV